MSRCFVAEDKAGKERKRRHIGGYDVVFVTMPSDAASRSNVTDQPENALVRISHHRDTESTEKINEFKYFQDY